MADGRAEQRAREWEARATCSAPEAIQAANELARDVLALTAERDGAEKAARHEADEYMRQLDEARGVAAILRQALEEIVEHVEAAAERIAARYEAVYAGGVLELLNGISSRARAALAAEEK